MLYFRNGPLIWISHPKQRDRVRETEREFNLKTKVREKSKNYLWAPSEPPLDPPLAKRTATICIEPSLRYSLQQDKIHYRPFLSLSLTYLSDMFLLKLFCWACCEYEFVGLTRACWKSKVDQNSCWLEYRLRKNIFPNMHCWRSLYANPWCRKVTFTFEWK